MGRKRMPGLALRGGAWHIDKRIYGRRICQSTGTSSLDEAERYLAKVMEDARQAEIYSVRPSRTFEQAAAKFVLENRHKRSINCDIGTGTINHGLQVVRRILNLASGEWMDERGLTWLLAPPKVKLFANTEKRPPYPLSWAEQSRLFAELPTHLAKMALFAVNTGCRVSEICNLRWDWELNVPELGLTVFIIPGTFVKNGEERLVVLNRIARTVVGGQRGQHATHVFSYNDRPVGCMLNSAWKKARSRAGLSNVRVHDLKHTFGRRLRAAGVSFEDRQDLLGHRSGRMTTHYSAAELTRLVEAAEMVCTKNGSHPELVVLRGSLKAPPAIDDFVQAKWLAGVPQNLSNIMHGSKRGIARAV